MRKYILGSLLVFFAGNAAVAQQTKLQKVAANPYEAPVKTVITQMLAIAAGREPVSKITGSKAPKPNYGSLKYEPVFVFPGGYDSRLERLRLAWDNNYSSAQWNWSSTVLQFIKNTQTERLKADQRLIVAAVQKLYPGAIRKDVPSDASLATTFNADGLSLNIEAYHSPQYSDLATLTFSVSFKKQESFMIQQLTDSLQMNLDRQLAASSSATEKGKLIKEWAELLELNGIDKSSVQLQGQTLLKKLASADPDAAFEMLMEWPQREEDLKKLQEPLSSGERDAIKSRAQKVIDDYRNNTTPKKSETVEAPDWSVFKGVISTSMATTEHKNFYDVVAKDLSGVLKETFMQNGGSYYRYAKDYKVSEGEYCHFSMSELKRNFVIVFYSEKAVMSKSYVSVNYEEGAVKDNMRVTGGNCTIQTDCSPGRICKTTCTGTIEVQRIGNNGFNYTFKLKDNPDLAGTKYVWTVLFDYKK